MRQFLLFGVPLLLPLAVYLVWFMRASRAAQAAGLASPKLGDVPWPWLLGIAALMLVSAIAAYTTMGGTTAGGHYEPAHMVDGKIVPGKIVP